MGGLGSFFKKATPYLAGAAAGGVSNMFGATRPYSAAISAGAGALTDKNRLAGAAKGFAGGGVGSALGGSLQGMSSGTGAGAGAMTGLKTYGNSIPGFGGIGTSNPTGMAAKFLTPQSIQNPSATSAFNGGSASALSRSTRMAPANANTVTGVMSQFGGGAKPAAPSTPSGGLKMPNLLGGTQGTGGGMNMGQMAAGLALPMAVSAFQPKVKPSDFSPVTEPLKEQINATYDNSPAKQFYGAELANTQGVDSTNGLAVDKMAHDKQVADTLRSFDQQWQGAMGGQDPSNNSEYQKQRMKILQDAESAWTANQSQFQFQYDQAQKQQKFAAAAALQGMDESQLTALAGLAQYDAYTISQKTGMDIAQAEQIQQLATTAGTIIMSNAAGMYGNNNASSFQVQNPPVQVQNPPAPQIAVPPANTQNMPLPQFNPGTVAPIRMGM